MWTVLAFFVFLLETVRGAKLSAHWCAVTHRRDVMLCDAQLLKTKRESKTSQFSESSSRNVRDWEDMTLSSSSLGVLYCKVPNRILADAFLLLSARLPVVTLSQQSETVSIRTWSQLSIRQLQRQVKMKQTRVVR